MFGTDTFDVVILEKLPQPLVLKLSIIAIKSFDQAL